jgi:phosphatidylinositol N-acetylglucosaminyltransferase subunit A
MGHKVVIITGTYNSPMGKRCGVRYMTNGLKVYYLPIVAMVDQTTLPTYMAYFPVLRR